MEGRRRQKWGNNNRSQNKRPPSGNWQRTVPRWEKEFCKVVGSLDWETLLQMKKFTHLYENVINWNDSAGEEAFSTAKKRFWAEINGLSCHLPLPDPNLYIDKIDWDSEINTELLSDIETEPIIFNADDKHDPVVIFGDSLFPNQSFVGWGDEDENFKAPDNVISPNHGDNNTWEENRDDLYDNGAAIGSSDYSNNVWGFGDGWNWNYSNNDAIYQVGPVSHRAAISVGQTWNH